MTAEKFKSKRWVCFIAALIATFCGGFGYAWSILQSAIMVEHPEWAASSIAITYTLQVSLSCLAPAIFGVIIKKLNTKQNVMVGGILYGVGLILCSFANSLPMLYICYGVLAGVGVWFIYPIMMSYAVRVLPDKGTLASGLMAAAYGSGAVVWAPVANMMIGSAGMGTTFLVLGVIFLIAIVAMSFLLTDVPEEYVLMYSVGKSDDGKPKKKVKDKTRGQMAKTGTFYIMCVCFILALTSGMLVISQAKSIVANTGGATFAAIAALCVSVITLFNTFGRIVWGAVAGKISTYNTAILLFVVEAVCMGALAVIPSGSGLAIVALMAITASCYGGFATMITPMTADMFGTKYLTENFGLMYIVYAFSSFIGPQLATKLSTVDATGAVVGYSKAFLVGAAFSVVGIVFAFLVKGQLKKVEYEEV